jgi:type II secretory pathway pseudopilin PulG
MIEEIILSIVIIALLAYMGLTQYYGNRERDKLIKALIAKNLKEVSDAEYLEKVKPSSEPAAQSEFIPMKAFLPKL